MFKWNYVKSSSHTLATSLPPPFLSLSHLFKWFPWVWRMHCAQHRLTRTAAYFNIVWVLFLLFNWHFNWRQTSSQPEPSAPTHKIKNQFVRSCAHEKAQLKEYKFQCCVPHRMGKVLGLSAEMKIQASNFDLTWGYLGWWGERMALRHHYLCCSSLQNRYYRQNDHKYGQNVTNFSWGIHAYVMQMCVKSSFWSKMVSWKACGKCYGGRKWNL